MTILRIMNLDILYCLFRIILNLDGKQIKLECKKKKKKVKH